jgi:hypothetical protein
MRCVVAEPVSKFEPASVNNGSAGNAMSLHVLRQLILNTPISIDQVLDVIVNGTVAKKEPDECGC